MAGFVKGMIPAVQRFVAERRTRCGPTEEDPSSFGRRVLAPSATQLDALPAAPRSPVGTPALPRSASLAAASYTDLRACARTASDASLMSDTASLAGSDRSVRSEGAAHSTSMRRLVAVMLASGVGIALARTASTSSLPPPNSHAGTSGSRSHTHGKRHAPGGSRHHSQRRHAGQGRHGIRGAADPATLRPVAPQSHPIIDA